MSKKGANPFGKNPDYFFIKGIDYLNGREISNAIKCFEKGVHDKVTHYLCRFNLAYTLFQIGHYQAALQHYETLSRQCLELKIHPLSKAPAVLFNKSVCELQAGNLEEAVKSAGLCLELIKNIEKENGGNILKLKKQDQEMTIDAMRIQGMAFFRNNSLGEAGRCLDAAEIRQGIID